MPIKFAVIALWAEDLPAAVHFYRDILGLEFLSHHAGRPHFVVNDVYLTIVEGRPAPAERAQPPRFPIFALSVDDLDAMVARLEKLRVVMPWGVEKDGHPRWVMFHDPAGNLIELVQFG